jgi:hypothetical protein
MLDIIIREFEGIMVKIKRPQYERKNEEYYTNDVEEINEDYLIINNESFAEFKEKVHNKWHKIIETERK